MEIQDKKQDWHSADVLAAVKKTGISLAALSRQYGLASGTLANTLKRKWPKGEAIIAMAINQPAENIWPSRYGDKKGMPVIK